MGALKRLAEGLLARGGPASWSLRRRRGRTLILAYHNVVPDGAEVRGERSLHLRRSDFARQLDALTASHEVVPLEACLAPAEDTGRPRAAITFDDAYRGAVTHGVEELVPRGLPATIFVAPGLLGGHVSWWDRAAGTRGGELEPGLRERALEELAGEEDAVLRWLSEDEGGQATDLAEPDASFVATASGEELARAAATSGITLGAHGWRHANLSRLEDGALREELERPLTWLRERFEATVPWLSYPYGRSSPRVERAAAEVGYEGAVRVDGGWVPHHGALTTPYALPRINVPAGLSLDGFRLRISGLLEA